MSPELTGKLQLPTHHGLKFRYMYCRRLRLGLPYLAWNTLRLLRRYVTTYSKGSILTHWCFMWLKSSGICLAGEERMHHISSQIVGDNPKGEIAPFSGGQVDSCQILGLTFAPIHNHMQNLMRIVQEHLLSIEPQLVAAIPLPAKRVKNKY